MNENIKEATNILKKNSIYYEIIGKTQQDKLNVNKEFDIKLSDLSKLNFFWFKNYFKEN